MRFLLFLELFLELGIGLLKIVDVILEKPCFPCPLLLQLVELLVKIDVLLEFFLDASIFRLELLEATLDCFQLLRFFWKYRMLSIMRRSNRSLVMMFLYPLPNTSRAPGLPEVPVASSVDGCGAPASQKSIQYTKPGI
jgi:hypothetical protein